jgi:LysM repeat protein
MSLYPNKRFCLFLAGILFIQVFLLPQEPVQVERSNNKVILDGTVYYIHQVKPGETLYAISRAYHISQKEIAIENPGVISGLQIGQTLKIPVDPKLKEEVDTSVQPEPGAEGRTHRVEAGETLYGIASGHGLREEELREANPGVSPENLQPGQVLRIPEKGEGQTNPAYNEEGLIYHKVKRRETLYSIANYYHVSVQDIRAANPELGWGGPKTGQTIRIPSPPLAEPQQAQEETREQEEISGEEKDWLEDYEEPEPANRNRTYRVAFFIPFDFHEMEPLDSLTKDIESASRKNRIIERYLVEAKIPQSVNFLEFFQGSLLAIDSMRQQGMRLDIRYFDTRKSMVYTSNLLETNDLEDFDLFIGPFYPYVLELVSAYALEHRIPLVTPFHEELDLIRDNPYLFQVSPSLEEGYREAAKLVASKHTYNIVYVRQEDSLNLEKHDYFKQLIFDGFDDYHPSEPVVFKEVIPELNRTDELIQSLSHDKKNLVVIPTDDEALASTVTSSLFHQLNHYDIEVLGGPYWTEFSHIDLEEFHKLKLIFYNSFWVDYHDPGVDYFMKEFREHFYGEPTINSSKGMNYGILGHDITLYFLNAMRIYGRRFYTSLEDYRPRLVQDAYQFSRYSEQGGYENTRIRFYRFMPDMSIQPFEVPPLPARHYYFRPLEDQSRRRFLYLDR